MASPSLTCRRPWSTPVGLHRGKHQSEHREHVACNPCITAGCIHRMVLVIPKTQSPHPLMSILPSCTTKDVHDETANDKNRSCTMRQKWINSKVVHCVEPAMMHRTNIKWLQVSPTFSWVRLPVVCAFLVSRVSGSSLLTSSCEPLWINAVILVVPRCNM